MKPQPSFKKVLLPGVLIILIVAVGAFLWKGTMNNNQGAALQNLNLLACPFNSTTPQVRVYAPNGGETYYSGQTILAKWGKCHVPVGTSGTLVLTKIGGMGPATYGPFTVTSSQSQLSIPIATLPGIYNGSNATTGVYRATITYSTATDSSDNVFYIIQSPIGLQQVFGHGVSGGASYNGSSQAGIELETTVRALGADIYLDKDVAYNTTATTGAQKTTLKEYFINPNYSTAAQTVLDAQITTPPTLTSLTPGVTLLPGGTYKIPAGTVASFKISSWFQLPTNAVAPYQRRVVLTWNGFSFATTNTNGNLYEPVPISIENGAFLQKF